ncbi:MAG: large conductance mechanosensitive channel protein MscL [Enterococcus sp.]|nr:large conductance mechanosensitive channel protein MscL [Enterococcus sp.]
MLEKKERRKKIKKAAKSTGNIMHQFGEFISQANVIGLAVAVVIGGAITALINSLVDDILMPLLYFVLEDWHFSNLKCILGEGEHQVTINYGNFINALISTLLLAFCIFILIRIFRRFTKTFQEKRNTVHTKTITICPFCHMEIHKEATRCPHCTSMLNKKGSEPIKKTVKDSDLLESIENAISNSSESAIRGTIKTNIRK